VADVLLLERFQKIRMMLRSLVVYRNLLTDPVLSKLDRLLDYLCAEPDDLGTFINLYNELFCALIAQGAISLEDHILGLILFDENPYSLGLAAGQDDGKGELLARTAACDLEYLQLIAGIVPADIKSYASKHLCKSGWETRLVADLPEWQTYPTSGSDILTSIKTEFCSHPWSECLPLLAKFYQEQGTGIFARYTAFSWERAGETGCLKGIQEPDPVRLSDLFGYERERAEVIENTLQFLNGFPANNVLLYGDRGTGKSSTVKAIANEYHHRGLRIVELSKDHLEDFPELIKMLRGRTQKFIIFVDDLSFEDSDDNYTALKGVLEGSLESRPTNVLIYATSNRRHLVKEKFSDQGSFSDEEIHADDTIQEKLSLADRFGITVIFSAPDQEQYLEIVERIAAQRGLEIPPEELQRKALQWEARYNGRSPRTARQFVDWLQGRLAY